jgi:putative membrane protein
LSSTSSTEPSLQTRSATEILASRYRHLFVLPSTPRLFAYAAFASLVLALISRGTGGILSFLLATFVFALSAGAISSALRISDRKSIATFRRTLAVLLGGEILWLILAAIGGASAWYSSSPYPLTNAFLFGALVCAGLEFLIINGAFTRSIPFSFALALLHPGSTALIVRFPELMAHFDLVAATCGVLSLALVVAFPLLLKGKKTSLGHDSLSLFRAFMKTWTAGNPDELEGIISSHSEEVEVTSKIIRFRNKGEDTFLVLPGVHPGPFHPVGSYDLPGVITRAFGGLGHVMTLHRPGGHERNLTTRAETIEFGERLKEFASTMTSDQEHPVMRGPFHTHVGKATVSASTFADDTIMTISFAPLGSDDLETKVETELAASASGQGLELSVVDAHNSIDSAQESPDVGDPGWNRLFETIKGSDPVAFGIGYSHSSEVGFRGQDDLTENGVGLLMVKTGSKSVLVLADANNAVPSLRGMVKSATQSAGYDLIEFCTSDTHNLAARGLTVERGYQALGEATPPETIADLVVKLAKLAETRVAPAQYASAQFESKVRVFGERALEEFASLTQTSSRFSGRYFRFTAVVVAALFLTSIVL